ncbi:hypothetical protein A2U01_0019161, partial [Trifolium medium]|nr:hypothetical protein [Trifolium medium]
ALIMDKEHKEGWFTLGDKEKSSIPGHKSPDSLLLGIPFIKTACLAKLAEVMDSATMVESVMIGCFIENQEITPNPIIKTLPEVLMWEFISPA